MHIVVEGCDGTGKTTLIKALSVAWGFPYLHQSPGPPSCSRELDVRVCKSIGEGVKHNDLISDRWPLISDYCYTGRGSIVRISASLHLGAVDRILHCDVDSPGQLQIEPRENDKSDLEQTMRIKKQVGIILERYTVLMNELRGLGHDVRRYVIGDKIDFKM